MSGRPRGKSPLTFRPRDDNVTDMRYALMVLCGLSVVGCRRGRVEPIEPVAPVATTRPTATRPAPADVMATVNGRPIYMAALIAPLVEAHGRQIAAMLIADALVNQEAERLKLAVTQADIDTQNKRMLGSLFGDDLSDDQRQRVLGQLLQRRGLTQDLWDATVRRLAVLRKMAEPRVTVSEPMVKAEYARQYGQKVQVGHIQLPTIDEAGKVIEMLKKGQDFAVLAKRYSTNSKTARGGGMLPPFSRTNTSVPKAMRDAAFALSDEGQISGIVQVENDFHVLKLFKRILAAEAKYEDVKEKVRAALRERLIERVQAEILAQLRRTADVEFVSPALQRAATRPTAGD